MVAYNVLQLAEGGDFQHKLIRSTKVYIPTKLSYEELNRHFWQGAVIARFSLSVSHLSCLNKRNNLVLLLIKSFLLVHIF
jgi:hypothetical protein